jgi:8-oxo-dGTP pyrophosphatase MutT (NUDIX family)
MRVLSFNPRFVPLVPTFQPEPALAEERLQPDALRQRWQEHRMWTPEIVREKKFGHRQPAAAAVLIPIVTTPHGLEVLLTVRTAHLSSHAGQIAFPGGRIDEDDPHPQAAALREAQEEIGLFPDAVEVIGTLPNYITGTAFHVTPVVGLLHQQPTLTPNPNEVDAVFQVPLSFLMNPSHHRRHRLDLSPHDAREWYSMPYHDGTREWFIWGATAGMLRNLYHFLAA